MRGRKREYIDLVLTEKKIERLHNGGTVQTMVNGQMYSIGSKPQDPRLAKIAALEAQLRALRSAVPTRSSRRSPSITPERLEQLRAQAAKARAAKLAKRSAHV